MVLENQSGRAPGQADRLGGPVGSYFVLIQGDDDTLGDSNCTVGERSQGSCEA